MRGVEFFIAQSNSRSRHALMNADLIDWFKTHVTEGEGYQTRINRTLREYITQRLNG